MASSSAAVGGFIASALAIAAAAPALSRPRTEVAIIGNRVCDESGTTGDCEGQEIRLLREDRRLLAEYTYCEGGCGTTVLKHVKFDPESGRLSFHGDEGRLRFTGRVRGNVLKGRLEGKWVRESRGVDSMRISLPAVMLP